MSEYSRLSLIRPPLGQLVQNSEVAAAQKVKAVLPRVIVLSIYPIFFAKPHPKRLSGRNKRVKLH